MSTPHALAGHADPIPEAEQRTLDACFLGPYGENDSLLERLVVEFLRDHVHWRRNFHPEDPPAIPTRASQHPAFQAFEARMRNELHQLSAALKRSVPFHSPRYVGHMVSDLLLPGLAAQMLTLPYNPNNVTEDAAPVTLRLEMQAGLQLARMLGWPDDPARPDCAIGHLTSGGTLANFQALRLALALKAFPVALRSAGLPGLDVPEDDWQAFNLGPAAAIEMLGRWRHWLAAQPASERAVWRARVDAERIEQLGLHAFFQRHPQLRAPLVLAPITAHYSWSKGIKMIGLGRDQLRLVAARGMRLCPEALEEALETCLAERQPVLMAVGVLGTTEYGTIDPIAAVVEARRRFSERGLGFSIHVDAAWGGYLTTLFRHPDGRLRRLDEVRQDYRSFPLPEVHAAFAALQDVDSVTIDPHKLAYLPYGAGAFVCRDHRAMSLLTEQADYVFDSGDRADEAIDHRHFGQFIPEGSKPGAMAAAVYVTHRVLPLDHAHFGLIPRHTVQAAEAFQERAERFARDMAGRVSALVPFPPDSNLVCLALNPCGNRDLARANAFLQSIHARLDSDPGQPIQIKQFFASTTSIRPAVLGEADMQRILAALGIDPDTLVEGRAGADRLFILRHTLMNPYLIDRENGISYIDRYFEHLTTCLLDASDAAKSGQD